ncbi:MopE-related protein, partial [Lewinella sp. JB7]|uniref:MopE-related protein n=1 Tax=Lewinella sp. JB7 TaxID=2962887 RepID=UPI0020C97000
DTDGDTYGDAAATITACTAPAGYVDQAGDCNDADPTVYPGAPELCDGIDNDCNGRVDDGDVNSTFYADTDGDGLGDPNNTTQDCFLPTGYVLNALDCDDTDANIGQATTFYADTDGDTYGDAAATITACTAPAGYVDQAGDCNDADPTVYPGAPELCDGIDNNCDGQADEGLNCGSTATAFWLEAECATVGAGWSSIDYAGASNGSYVVFPGGGDAVNTPPADLPANRIRFTVTNAEAGSYNLFARIGAPSGNNDSYWVRVNGGNWYKWFSGMTRTTGTGFAWNAYPGGNPTLVSGVNTIDFAYREGGTLLDKLYLAKAGTLPTGTGSPATNCATPPVNQPPVAQAGATPTSGTSPLNVQFSSTGSFDPDGTIDTYSWTWPGGSASGDSPTATFATGTYAVTLTVTDNQGAQATDVVTINATAPPVADKTSFWLEAECAAVGTTWSTVTSTAAANGEYVVLTSGESKAAPPADVPANRVRFTVAGAKAGSYHLFARIDAPTANNDSYWVRVNGGTWYRWWSGMTLGAGFQWNQYPGGMPALSAGTNTIDFAYREVGTRLDKLHLNLTGLLPSGVGGQSTNCDTPPVNQPPVARAGATPTSGTSPLNVQFSSTGSFDPDGTIDTYAWAWPGGTANGDSPTATFATGTYAVTLTVTDNQGAQATDVVTINATAPPVADKTSFWLEAECAAVGSTWSTVTSTAAANGEYVVLTSGESKAAPPADVPANRVRFTVAGAKAGSYHLFARIDAPTVNNDSYWVRVNGGSWYRWWSGMTLGAGFQWNQYPGGMLALSAGTNTIDFAYREVGTRLDKLHLNLTGLLPTGVGEQATNCDTAPPDSDGDGIADSVDNCPNVPNPDQNLFRFYADFDGDGYGDPNDFEDACTQPFGYVTNQLDNCPSINTDNLNDSDGDGIGDACDTPDVTDFWMEAECATVGSGWSVVTNTAASNGAHVNFTGDRRTAAPPVNEPAQEVRFDVSLTQAGTYHLYLRLSAPDESRNSLWVRVDQGPWMKMWKTIGGASLLTNGLEWRKANDDGVDRSFPLTAGNHTVTVANREPGTLLDKVLLTTTATVPSGVGLAASNCGPAAINLQAAPTFAKESTVTVAPELSLYPNPVADRLNVLLQSDFRGTVDVLLTDATGRTIRTLNIDKQSDEMQHSLQAAGLPAGVYRLRVIEGDRQITKPFMKL